MTGEGSAEPSPVKPSLAAYCFNVPDYLFGPSSNFRWWRQAMTNVRFVITGGPGAGKTAVLDVLAVRGFHCVPDTARAIIRRRKRAGLSPRPALEQFGREMLQADIAQYRDTPVLRDPVFFERGVCDALEFLTIHAVISEAEAATYVNKFPYNEAVFLLPPWEEIYTTDTERDQSFTEAVAVCESVRRWYARWGYQLVEVPTGNVGERVDFILRTIETVLPRLA